MATVLSAEGLRDCIIDALDDGKGRDIVALDVTDVTDITDFMVIASGTSSRHVKALVDRAIEAAKESSNPPIGVEGKETAEWVLVDLGDVVVHIMQSETRAFYDLERLWSEIPTGADSNV